MKKLIVILSLIIIILSTVFIYLFFQNKNEFKRSEQNFYEAIDLLKEEKYQEAYQLTNEINDIECQKTIKNIIAYSYLEKITECMKKLQDVSSESSSLVQTAVIKASILGSINISESEQSEIDQKDKEIMDLYGNLNTTYSKEILYDDLNNLYDSYQEFINAFNGLNENLQDKLSNDESRKKLGSDMTDFTKILQNLSNHINDVKKLHPLSEIPERYRIMFDLDNNK